MAVPGRIYWRSTIVFRVLAAVAGGYLLANCAAIGLAHAFPGPIAQGVMTGLLISYLVYAVAAMWAFAAKTAWQAWLGILVACLACGPLIDWSAMVGQ